MNCDAEKLNAYVDEELDDASAEEVVRQIETDEPTKSLVDDLQAVDRLIEQAYSEVLSQPVPRRLLDAVAPPAPRPRFTVNTWQLRFAAVLAMLAVGLSTGYFVAQRDASLTIADLESRNSQLTAALEMATTRALEYQPSGMPLSETGGTAGWQLTVTPLQTFRTAANRYCRSVQQEIVRDGSPQLVTSLWCRNEKGQWQIQSSQPVPESRSF